MLNLFILCCAVLFAAVKVLSCPNNLLVIYGNDHSEIIIKNVTTRKTVKIFTIQIGKAKGGIAIDYKKDLIFFADEINLYRIHLVDDKGNRKISGKGELFTNKSADHFELLFYHKYFGNIFSFFLDKKLYVVTSSQPFWKYKYELHSIDPERGYEKTISCFKFPGYKYQHSIYAKGILYFSDGDGIYKSTIAKLSACTWWRPQINKLAQINSLSTFTIDKCTNKLFYIQRSAIRVLDGNLTTTPFSKDKAKIVLADSYVTKKANAIAVRGNIVIWSSYNWSKLYIGKFNKNTSFIATRNIHVLDGTHHKFKFNNIMIFEHNFKK